jgi:hypothetical protein
VNRQHRPRSRRRQREHRLGNRRANRIRINLDDSELATLEAAAHAHEVGVARWVAESALSVASGQLSPLPVGQRALLAELINSQIQVRRLTAALRELNPPPPGIDPAALATLSTRALARLEAAATALTSRWRAR